MPIKVVLENNQFQPRIFCDHCGNEITNGDDGNYENADEDVASVYFTHNDCSTPFRLDHPEISVSEKVTALPHYLANNLRIDAKTALNVVRMGNQL